MSDFLNKIITSSKYILALLAVFLIGAAVGALVFYQLNSEIFVTKATLAEFEKKFQEKIKNGAFPLIALSSLKDSEPAVDSISGTVESIDSSTSSFLVKVKNIYRGSSVVDFVLNQPDFYNIKIIIDEKTRLSDYIWEPISSEKLIELKGEQGLGIINPPPPPEKNIKLKDLSKNQETMITLREKIYLSKTSSVKADLVRVMFGSQPPPPTVQKQ